jgi:hypothetical protein
VALYAALGMPVPSSEELSEVREDVLTYKSRLSRSQDAWFKVSVISGYYFTSALTGYRLIASKSTYVPLEAAHIHAHARKGPDSPDNGLALTPTALPCLTGQASSLFRLSCFACLNRCPLSCLFSGLYLLTILPAFTW